MIEPYYQDEQATIYCGDCREILPTLGRFDLLLTDPPYGYNWNTNYSRFTKGFTDKDAITNDGAGQVDLMPCFEATSEQIIFGCNCIPQSTVGSYLIWDKRCADGFAFLSDGGGGVVV